MPIMDWVKGAGGKLGLVRFVSTTAPAAGPKKIPTRVVTLKELLAEVRAQAPATDAGGPAELEQPFDEIYRAAGVTPPEHGWTVQRLAEWLRAEVDLKAPRETIQLNIVHKLASEKAHVQDIVKDALERDQALDARERALERGLEDRARERRLRAEQIEQQIQALQQRQAELKKESQADTARWHDWYERKNAVEKDMAWVLDFLINEKVVSVGKE